MNELTYQELQHLEGGTVSTDTVYGAALGAGGFALGALLTIATGGVAAPVFAIYALGVFGTGANIVAITMAL